MARPGHNEDEVVDMSTSAILVVTSDDDRSVMTDPAIEYVPVPVRGTRYEVEVAAPEAVRRNDPPQ